MISDGLVRLRPLDRSDLAACRGWVNDAANLTALLRALPVSDAHQERWFDDLVGSPDRLVLAVERVADARHIGNVGFYHIHRIHRSAEFWVLIGAPAERGRGWGGRATALMLRYGYEHLNLRKIYLHVAEDNLPARRLYESQGFVLEGVLREEVFREGRYVNVCRMARFVSGG